MLTVSRVLISLIRCDRVHISLLERNQHSTQSEHINIVTVRVVFLVSLIMIGYPYHDNNETKLYPDSDYIDMLSFE